MEDQQFVLLRDTLSDIKTTCKSLDAKLDSHITKDETYWQKIDQQEGAVGVWKWIAGLGGGTGFLAGLSQYFGKH
jgi:hypothetical protein